MSHNEWTISNDQLPKTDHQLAITNDPIIEPLPMRCYKLPVTKELLLMGRFPWAFTIDLLTISYCPMYS